MKDESGTYVFEYDTTDNKWTYSFVDANGNNKTYDINSVDSSGGSYTINFTNPDNPNMNYILTESSTTTIPYIPY